MSVAASALEASGLTKDELLLAQLGYRQEFKRDFGVLELFGLGFSIIGVLPSIASVLVYSIPYGGAVTMVWGWAVCSIFLVFIGLAMSELGSAAPTAGGVYYWTFKFSSPGYRTYMCWIIGYVNTIAYVSGACGIDWGCAVQIMAAISIGSDLTFQPTVFQIFGVFVALVILHACICSLATKIIAKLQLLFITANVVLCLAVIIGIPVNTPTEFRNNAAYVFGNFENLSMWPNGFAFILGFLAPLWVVGGFDSSVHISEEARNASVAIPWAIMSAATLSCILGWGINIALAFNMGTDVDGIMNSPIGQPLAAIFFNSLGKKGTLGLWSFLILTQLMMGTSALTASSRQMFAFSRDGALPFSRFLYHVSPTNFIPTRCVWGAAFCAIALGVIALAGPAASGAIFSMGVVGQYICYFSVIIARWTGGYYSFRYGPFNLGVFSLPVSAVAVLFMLFMCVILLFPSEPQVSAPAMNYTVLVIGGIVALASLYYFCPVYGGVHWFKGPVVTVDSDGVVEGTRATVLHQEEKEKGN